jgi:hypothetical protein
MLNYHEMTMNEPRNSPARRQQYLIICTVMAVAFLHSVITAGGCSTIDIREGIFPGGDFVYRLSQRYEHVKECSCSGRFHDGHETGSGVNADLSFLLLTLVHTHHV